jgi:predicted transposase YdaD
MIRKAAKAFLQNHEKLREEVNEIMEGQVLDYETKRARREGRAEGQAEGRAEGRAEGLAEGLAEGQTREALQTAGRLFERGFSYEDVRAVVTQVITDDELHRLEKEAKKENKK